ncbi:hypothetical protein CsSME_00037099 [Camellia sinensis var. sinensis]
MDVLLPTIFKLVMYNLITTMYSQCTSSDSFGPMKCKSNPSIYQVETTKTIQPNCQF